MKAFKTIYLTLALAGAAVFASCTSVDYPDRFQQTKGVPTIYFVRMADEDVAISQGSLDQTVCVVGDNLTSVHEIYFNDQKAILNTSYMTAHTILVAVPRSMPNVATDEINFITRDSTVVKFPFKVLAPAPKITGMSNEWASPGESVTILGSYFTSPVTVKFPGADEIVITESPSLDQITVTVPTGSEPGRLVVTTDSGSAQSAFMYKDTRGMLFNFDDDPHPANHGWHAQVIETDETALSGKFLRLGDAGVTLSEEGGWDDGHFSFEYWPGDWDDPVSYADSPRLTDFADFSQFANMALKFEMYIPTSNPWKAGSMQLIVGGVDLVTGGAAGAKDKNGKVTAGANNTFISGGDDGSSPQGPRAHYVPWKDTGSFDTGNKWITVSIPLSNFIYDKVGAVNPITLTADCFTSLTIFVWAGGTTGTECNPIIKIDNIRAVPIK